MADAPDTAVDMTDANLVGECLDDCDLVSEDGTTMPHQLRAFGKKLEVNRVIFDRELWKRRRTVGAKTEQVSRAWRAVVKQWREDANVSLAAPGGDGVPHRTLFPNWANRDAPLDAHWSW